jgi:hypothetical protein
MTLRGRLRVTKRKLFRSIRPRRLVGSVMLLAVAATAVWLLVLVVSESAIPSSISASAPTTSSPSTTPRTRTHPPTTTIAPHRSTGATKHHAASRPVGSTVPLGVYAGPAAVAGANTFSAAVGTQVPYAFDYLDGTSWQTIEDPAWFLHYWDGSGFRMIWGVPMLPRTGGATMAAGAAGQYNSYFTQLAQVLVANGQGNSLIELGWDPGAANVAWAALSPASAQLYVAYWRQVVTSMRSVPDQQFLFVWDDAAASGVTPSMQYPGNAYVDVVATDAFDLGLGVNAPTWNELASAPYGQDWFSNFAAQHKKQFMIAKWGVVPTADTGGGDNPTFVKQFLSWANRENLVTAVVWNEGPWALTDGSFPQAARMLHTVAAEGAVQPIAKAVGA